jgi:nucleotide-binding universal stress UspA family protein
MKLLVATDVRDISAHTVEAVDRLVGPGDEVHVLSVVDPADVQPTYANAVVRLSLTNGRRMHARLAPIPLEPSRLVAETAMQAADRVTRERHRAISEALGAASPRRSWDVHVEVDRSVADTILRWAHDLPAAAIVLGPRRRSGIVATLLGSTGTSVIRRASVPVIIIPDSIAAGARGPVTAAS